MRLPVILLFLFGLLAARAAAGPFTGEPAVIAKIRAASNAAIAAHDAAQVCSFMDPDVRITAGSGHAVAGREQVQQHFLEQFRATPGLVYVRTPARITPSAVNPLAAESGTWVGTWTESGKAVEVRGEYMAMWRKTDAGWLIRSELFVTLERRENGVPVTAK